MSEDRPSTFAELLGEMGPPTDDDVPMTLDWEPLDTKEKLVSYLEEINRRRDAAHVLARASELSGGRVGLAMAVEDLEAERRARSGFVANAEH